jgi:hypothetical protein
VATVVSHVLGKKVETVMMPREPTVEMFAKDKGIASVDGKDNFERMLFYYDKR